MEISVLMSVYYKESPMFLEKSIGSILLQTKMPKQIVIVKDGKLSDDLEMILNKYQDNPIFTIVGYEENKGLGFALKYGLSFCDNEIVARMDSDDICDSKRFEKQYEFLTGHPDVSIVGSNCLEFNGEIENVISKRIMPETNKEISDYSHTRNPFIHPSIMTYKKTIIDAGNYRNYYLCEDYDLWVRILKNSSNKAYNIQENLVYMRVSEDFYRRRGGLKYCKAILNFKKELYKTGYIKHKDYFKTKYATLIVSLLPGFLREFIYKKFLRNK